MLFGMIQESLEKLSNNEPKREILRVYIHDNMCTKTITETTDKLVSLTQLFSRSANETMTSLQKSLTDAQTLILSIQKLESTSHPTPTHPEQVPVQEPSPHVPETEVRPFITLEAGNTFKKFDFYRLNSELTFENTFSNRKVAYFGEFPYKYTGGYHRAKQIPSDSYLAEILLAVQDFFKDHNLNYCTQISIAAW